MEINQQAILDAISEAVGKYLIKACGDKYDSQGYLSLQGSVLNFMAAGSPIRFVLPGFPCKSPNLIDKSFGVMPDLGEAISLKRLHSLAEEISEIYEHGCHISVLSDGTTFNDIVGVPDEIRVDYNRKLRKILPSSFISWFELRDFIKGCETDEDIRKSLIKSANLPYRNLDDLIRSSRSDQHLRTAHDNLCSYLYNDVRLNRSPSQSEDDYLHCVSHKAYEMMLRGMALNALIERSFPDAIRLSVHQYNNEGPKFTFAFMEGAEKVVQPWHSVPVISMSGHISLKGHAHVDKEMHALVHFNGAPWCYIEVDNPQACSLRFNLLKLPTFGLEVSGLGTLDVSAVLSPELLAHLSEQFGFLCLRDIDFKEKSQLVDFCEPFGNIYQWKFGPVHVVKPEDKPDGFVHSLEKTPVHWDLSMLPLEHEQVKKDPWFTATKFMLYCKTPPQEGEGQTTVVDGRIVLDMVGSKLAKEWESTNITYDTRMTYFGGCPRTYPLVHVHPIKGNKVFRYQEGSESELQKFTVTVDGYAQSKSDELIAWINKLIYDNRCMIAHDWKAGDLIIVDNWLTLHGRLPMSENSSSRELWRVQVF
ncbi:TPA: L-tyrosine/L-tryptophan isonitrile synthase family protein [Serratia marcescens]|nr:L-tyrosine/L-tryptophan isonitrile synthase family protein [Serratia marcescens]